MSARNLPVNSQLNTLTRREVRPPAFKTKSASSLQWIPNQSLPMRIAVIGNHLPRQCGIATFTTDLCDAIAAEYGAAGLSVVAVNDPLSSYVYPMRVRFEIAESDISSYRAAADFLNSNNVDLVCLQHEYGIFGGKVRQSYLEVAAAPRNASGHNSPYRSPSARPRPTNVMHQIAALRSSRL
jgi:hypothetical protein